ncbi:MAG: LysM peptidoglycan-binding domain-containing protein [Clostridia bacterium]|nr:LysM peptidoglycan-binding domain-containing protein [Clostridia bacterium]
MFIHTVSEGETLFSIGRKYGVSATKIIENNDLAHPDRISVGQKLVIFTPTRTYTVRGGDTLESISRRFGVGYKAILRANPSLCAKECPHPEEVLAIKYDVPSHGAAVLNGYFYKGCTKERLMLALAYSNCISVSAYKANAHGGIDRLFNDAATVDCIREHNRRAIMRVYDGRDAGAIKINADKYIRALADAAKRRGYDGIALGAYNAAKGEGLGEFLMSLKKHLLSEGLSLTLEVDGNEPEEYSEIADACVLISDKCALEEIPSFAECEEQLYNDFAQKSDSSKTFIDLSPFAYADNMPISHREAHELAYRMNKEILYDPDKKICHFEYSRFHKGKRASTRVIFESPENIKAKLGLLSSLGYMGISFDVERVPVEHLMMCAATFACGTDYTPLSLDI